MAKDAEGIRVVIYDQEYFVRGDLDEEYIQKLAQYLDAKMRAIAGRTRTVDSLRVAVLAALNIADEYHQVKAKYEQQPNASTRRWKSARGCSTGSEGSGVNPRHQAASPRFLPAFPAGASDENTVHR